MSLGVQGPHLCHRRRSRAPPGASTRGQREPPAWGRPVQVQPPPPEAGGPAAGGKHQADGSGHPPLTSTPTVPDPSGERSGHQHPGGRPLPAPADPPQGGSLPGPQRCCCLTTPPLGLCISVRSLWAGLREWICRHRPAGPTGSASTLCESSSTSLEPRTPRGAWQPSSLRAAP